MGEKSGTAFSAVGVIMLLLVSALVWGEFGAFGLSVIKAWTGG
jgi:hypothetical protein